MRAPIIYVDYVDDSYRQTEDYQTRPEAFSALGDLDSPRSSLLPVITALRPILKSARQKAPGEPGHGERKHPRIIQISIETFRFIHLRTVLFNSFVFSQLQFCNHQSHTAIYRIVIQGPSFTIRE